jgi:hypothetical protein
LDKTWILDLSFISFDQSALGFFSGSFWFCPGFWISGFASDVGFSGFIHSVFLRTLDFAARIDQYLTRQTYKQGTPGTRAEVPDFEVDEFTAAIVDLRKRSSKSPHRR